MGLGVLFRRGGDTRPATSRAVRLQLLTVGAVLAIVILWLYSVSSIIIVYNGKADIRGQLGYILHNPMDFLWMIFLTILINFIFYFKTGVGMLGWFTLPLPSFSYQLVIVGFILSLLLQKTQSPLIYTKGSPWWNLSLEHNANFAEILNILTRSLADRGRLILSGPTENFLYRLGRRVAGFSGEYHKVTISEIEQATRRELFLTSRRLAPFGLPLFAVSVWRKHPHAMSP